MKDVLNVGLLIADDAEYAALQSISELILKEKNFGKRPGHTFSFEKNSRKINVWAICTGIGKVNAATAAQKLICDGADLLVNYGLSGGISGVSRGEDVVGTSFFEHDFDLTCFNYKPCEKPGQTYIYETEKSLVDMALKAAAPAKSGKLATGDCFVSNSTLKNLLKNEFNVTCCDMETAAMASAAFFGNVPFVSLRGVSDDAGECATTDYREMNNAPQEAIVFKALSIIKAIFEKEDLWV